MSNKILRIIARILADQGMPCCDCRRRERDKDGLGCVHEKRCLEDIKALRKFAEKS